MNFQDKISATIEEGRVSLKPGNKVIADGKPGTISAMGGDYIDVIHHHDSDHTPKSYHKSKVRSLYAKPIPAHKIPVRKRLAELVVETLFEGVKPGDRVIAGGKEGSVSSVGGSYVDIVHDDHTEGQSPTSYHISKVKKKVNESNDEEIDSITAARKYQHHSAQFEKYKGMSGKLEADKKEMRYHKRQRDKMKMIMDRANN